MGGTPDRMDDDGRHAGSERQRREVGRIIVVAMRGGPDQIGGDERRARSEQRQ
jgi:hypothetical protein